MPAWRWLKSPGHQRREAMVWHRIYRFALLIALSALTLTAQTGSGTVQGVVRDASSAVVAGAKVTIVHTATMREYSTTANDVGSFVFPPVQPGAYEIAATSTGMETWKGTFLLAVGQTVEISPVLRVGAVTTQVTVGDAAHLVSTSDATISRNLERARIEQLPVDGRNISNLVLMSTPSLVGGQDGANNPINTGLRDAVELYQDGAVKKNRDVGDWAGRLPGVDSVQELRVETSLSSALFDQPGSVILSTRGGTNNIHGSLFETNRNSGVGVARRRQDYYTKPPHYVRNEFGGSVGGPVYIPKLYNGKNRTFFFTSYELLRQVSASTASTTMPTDAMRNGDYSGLVDSLGRLNVIYDPLSTGPGPTWTRTPFPNNTIPTVRESPNAKYLYGIMPKPTFTNINPNIGNNYFGLLSNATSDSMSTSRIDQRIGDRDQVFGRFSVARDTNNYQTNSVPALSGPLNYVYNYYGDVSAVGSWSHTFSPTFLSETQVSYSHEYKFTGSPNDPNIANMADYLNMPNLGNDPLTAYQTSGMGFGVNFSMQQARQNTSNIFVVNQNFTRMWGRHQIQFGGRLHLEYLNVWIDQPTSTISYDSGFTSLFDPASGSAYSAAARTGFSGASFFLGYVGTFKDTVKRPAFDLRDREVAGYIQDNWKATPRLTLNIGLRYQWMPPQVTAGNLAVGFDQNTDSMVLARPLSERASEHHRVRILIEPNRKITGRDLRRHPLVAQADIQGQPGSCFPIILNVAGDFSVAQVKCGALNRILEGADVAEEEARPRKSGARGGTVRRAAGRIEQRRESRVVADRGGRLVDPHVKVFEVKSSPELDLMAAPHARKILIHDKNIGGVLARLLHRKVNAKPHSAGLIRRQRIVPQIRHVEIVGHVRDVRIVRGSRELVLV